MKILDFNALLFVVFYLIRWLQGNFIFLCSLPHFVTLYITFRFFVQSMYISFHDFELFIHLFVAAMNAYRLNSIH